MRIWEMEILFVRTHMSKERCDTYKHTIIFIGHANNYCWKQTRIFSRIFYFLQFQGIKCTCIKKSNNWTTFDLTTFDSILLAQQKILQGIIFQGIIFYF